MAKYTGIKGTIRILLYLALWRFCIDSLWTAYTHAETRSTHAEITEVTRSSIQSIVHPLLTSPNNEIKYKTPKIGIEGYTEPHKWSQQTFDSNLLTFWSWYFLKRPRNLSTEEAVGWSTQGSNSSRSECLLSPPNFQTGSEAHKAFWLVFTGLPLG